MKCSLYCHFSEEAGKIERIVTDGSILFKVFLTQNAWVRDSRRKLGCKGIDGVMRLEPGTFDFNGNSLGVPAQQEINFKAVEAVGFRPGHVVQIVSFRRKGLSHGILVKVAQIGR